MVGANLTDAGKKSRQRLLSLIDQAIDAAKDEGVSITFTVGPATVPACDRYFPARKYHPKISSDALYCARIAGHVAAKRGPGRLWQYSDLDVRAKWPESF